MSIDLLNVLKGENEFSDRQEVVVVDMKRVFPYELSVAVLFMNVMEENESVMVDGEEEEREVKSR